MSARIFHENPVEHAVDEELRWENGFEMQKSKTSESSICSFSDRNSRPWTKNQVRVREKVFRLMEDFSVIVDFLNFDWDIQYFSNSSTIFPHFSFEFQKSTPGSSQFNNKLQGLSTKSLNLNMWRRKSTSADGRYQRLGNTQQDFDRNQSQICESLTGHASMSGEPSIWTVIAISLGACRDPSSFARLYPTGM